jgi:CHAD domain-containing protein
VLSAAEKVLGYQSVQLATATRRLFEERDAASVRRLLIAAHRIRIALELFADYLPPRAAKRLHRGLRGTARALDALGDLDLIRAHVADARAAAEPDEQAAFDAVLEDLDVRRASALNALEARLQADAHGQWLRRFGRLLSLLREQIDAGLSAGDNVRALPDDYVSEESDRPQRTQLQHMLGSCLWSRYEALQAYDDAVAAGANSALYPLGVACSALQFALGLAAGCCGEDVRRATRPLGQVESHLVLLHHARVAAEALSSHTAAAPVAALAERLHALADEAQAEVPAEWARVREEDFRQVLGRLVASIGSA